MKKVFTLFFMLFIILIDLEININANSYKNNSECDIIAELGSGKNSDLFTGDVKEISGEVDWNKSGDYQVTCTRIDNTILSKTVYVRDYNTLLNGFDVFKDIGSLNFTIKNLTKILSSYVYKTSLNIYYAYYNCLLNNGDLVAYICKYEKNKVSKIAYLEDISNVKKLCFVGEYVYALVNVVDTVYSKIKINKYDSEMNLINSYELYSNSNDQAMDMFYAKDMFYIFLNTSSNEGIIERAASNKIALILKLNISNFVIEDYLEISNNYDNELIKCTFDNNIFTILVSLNGSSGKYYHTINKSYSGQFIVSFDVDFNQTLNKSIEDESIKYDNIAFNSKRNLMVWTENKKKIHIKYGEMNKEKTITIDEYSKEITSLHSLIIDNRYYIFVCLDSKLSKLIMIIDDKKIERNINNINLDCRSIYVHNDKIFLKLGDSELRLYSYETVKLIKKQINYKENEEIKTEICNVLIDEKEVESVNENEILDDKFGSHYTFLKCYTSNYLILYKSKYTIPLSLNIRDNEKYDPGIALCFNGSAKLNDKDINSNYIVYDIGKYQLEIYSGDNEKIIINFEIIDACVKEKDYANGYHNIIDYMGYEMTEDKNLNCEINYSEEQYQEKAIDEITILIISIFIIASIIVVKVFKRKEKKL